MSIAFAWNEAFVASKGLTIEHVTEQTLAAILKTEVLVILQLSALSTEVDRVPSAIVVEVVLQGTWIGGI